MTTRAQLEKILIEEAHAHGYKGERLKKYVFGTLNKIFARQKQSAARRRRTVRAKAPTRARRKNPVISRTSKQQMNLIKGIQLFQKFRLQDPKFISEKKVTFHRELLVIGVCDGVLYTTIRQGHKERYRHLFTGDSKPLLCSSWDGKQLYLIDGKYNFTERGIVDA